MTRVILRGGPRDGTQIDFPTCGPPHFDDYSRVQSIRVPVEAEDGIGAVDYNRTAEEEDGRVVFRAGAPL